MKKLTGFNHEIASDVGNFFYSLKSQGLELNEVLSLTAAYINSQIMTQAWERVETAKLMMLNDKEMTRC